MNRLGLRLKAHPKIHSSETQPRREGKKEAKEGS